MSINSSPELLFLTKLVPVLLALLLLGFSGLWLLTKLYGRQRSKTIIATIALVATSTVVALGVSEAVVRYVYRDISSTPDNSSYFAHRWQREYPPQINRLGFREREINPIRPEDVYRIAVIGDSLTYGQGIEENKRFTNLLEQYLNKSGMNGRYEILNFGRPGTETVDHIIILKEFVIDIQPNFVLLQWYVNDAEGHNKDGRPWFHRLIPSDMIVGFLHDHFALFYLLNQQWHKIQPKFDLGSGYNYTEYMIKRFKNPNSKDSREARKALQEFIELCERNRIPVGIVIFPELTEDLLASYPLGFLLDQVLLVCEERGTPCLDLASTKVRNGS